MSNLEELPDGVVVFRFFNKSTSGRARTERTGDKCVEQSKSFFILEQRRKYFSFDLCHSLIKTLNSIRCSDIDFAFAMI